MSDRDYAIGWAAPTQPALTRLPEKVATVIEFLYGSLAANPHRVGKPLKLDFEGLHGTRRGDYRIIYRIDEDDHRIDVIASNTGPMPTAHPFRKRPQRPSARPRADPKRNRATGSAVYRRG